MILLQGLGLNKDLITATTAYVPGQGLVTEQAPSTKPVGWTRWGIDQAKYTQWQQPEEARIRAVQAALMTAYGPQLPASTNKFTQSCAYHQRNGFVQLLAPIGVAMNLGVPFDLTELKAALEADGSITRAYAPDPIQQWWADLAIYQTSQRVVAGYLGKTLADGTDLLLDLTKPDRGIQKIVNFSGLSVDQMIAKSERNLAWYLHGFGHNPIVPTDEERTQEGGLATYYARGGFLLSIPHGEARAPILIEHMRATSGYALCGEAPIAVYEGIPSGLPWVTFVAVDPAQYTMRVQPKDPSTLGKAISTIASVLDKIGDWACSEGGPTAQVNAILNKELCHDTAMKDCKKGTPGCYCTAPTSLEKGAVAVADMAVKKICERRGDGTQAPFNPGFIPPPFAIPGNEEITEPGLTVWQMALLAIGGLGVGAFLARR